MKLGVQAQRQRDVRIHFDPLRGPFDWDGFEADMDEGFIHLSQVPDPQRDEGVLFLCKYPLTCDVAQEIWDNWDWQQEEDEGRA